MTIADEKEMLLKIGDGSYAVGAFNTTNLVQIEAVVEAAVERTTENVVKGEDSCSSRDYLLFCRST